jgi:hypothetical protein
MSFMIMMSEGRRSYWEWSRSLTRVVGKTISKQAIFSRMTPAWTATVKALLEEVISQQAQQQVKYSLFAGFGNVWLQDSTTLHLPDILQKRFKGNWSRGKQKSVAKVNVVINVLSGVCPVLNWMSYTINEQSLSTSIQAIADKGDLVIRDLGYFVLENFKQLQDRGIYFLSRLRSGVNLYEAKSEKEIQIYKLLKGKLYVDKHVVCGKDKHLKVRLVAIKLSESQTNQRIRKAKKDRDRRLNHSKEYYRLLGYVIFITNVDAQVWDGRQVAEAYRVRWNIEILFKSWKSGFHIQEIIPEARAHTQRVESVLYLILIFITWFQMLVYIPLRLAAQLKGKYLSVIKTVKFVLNHLYNFINSNMDLKLQRHLIYYCCYDKRSDRLNATERLEQFYILLA